MTKPSRYKVSHKQAEEIFIKALDEAKNKIYSPQSEWKNEIKLIILGNHLTYRYILITGLLGKATNENVNPLALQASSKLEGAYDARSLCHTVIVPLERKLLDRCLGGSNEPFLNKPARFTEISLSNAVRRGGDTEKLKHLHNILSGMGDSATAYNSLCDALYFTALRCKTTIVQLPNKFLGKAVRTRVTQFADYFLCRSIEGQTSPILLGALLQLYYSELSSNYQVIVHPVNQSGASSKEISDIDVLLCNKVILSIEVKDKHFREQDVDHAVHKVAKAGQDILILAIGPRGLLVNSTEGEMLHKASEQGVDLIFVKLIDMAKQLLSLTRNVNVEKFFKILIDYAQSARVKDEVIELIEKYLEE